jgi:hypothetical protein
MCYPDECIRGIINDTYMDRERGDDKLDPRFFYDWGPERADGWRDLSINWYDDDEALEMILNQEKDGEVR